MKKIIGISLMALGASVSLASEVCIHQIGRDSHGRNDHDEVSCTNQRHSEILYKAVNGQNGSLEESVFGFYGTEFLQMKAKLKRGLLELGYKRESACDTDSVTYVKP